MNFLVAGVGRFFSFLWRVFRGFLIFLGFMMFISIIAGVAIGLKSEMATPVLPKTFVLNITVDDGFTEHENFISAYDFRSKPLIISEVIDALDRAQDDNRVKGLVLRLAGGDMTLTQLYELAHAVEKFREKGKLAYIYGTSYGAPGAGLGTYYLASAFDKIWLQPMGDVSLAGIRAEMPFAREALDKIGVKPQFFTRKEYKSVFENLTAREMSAANRQAMDSLIHDIADTLILEISQNRSIDQAQTRTLMDQGVFTDEEALRHNIVTNLGDYEAMLEDVAQQVTGKKYAKNLLVGINRYIRSGAIDYTSETLKNNPRAAVIYISGAIVSKDEAGSGGMSGGDMTIAEDIVTDIQDAIDDKNIKAIVVRVDSPGGSPTASETIRLALLRAKQSDKKIIISMASAAASGGYWIASAGDYIFASPLTITGSIGVAGGKFSLHDLWAKLGIRWDGIKVGENAGMMSLNEPFTPAGEARMNALMDHIYNNFIKRVAEGRKMDIEDVEMIARGRVWSGRQARANGLVDQLGGLDEALDYTAQQLGAKDRHAMPLVILPRPQTPVERLAAFVEGQVSMGYSFHVLSHTLRLMTGAGIYDPVLVH